MSEAEDQTPELDENDLPLPPVSFEFLILSLKMQAEMQLGLLHFGEDRPKANPGIARHTIDLIGVLQEKTKGNLSMDEQRLIENSLTELRFRYIQAVNEAKQQPGGAKQEGAAE